MNGEGLLRALNDLDDAVLLDAEQFASVRNRSTLRRIVTVALAAVLMLAMSITAVGYFSGAEWFEKYFSWGRELTEEQAEFVTDAMVDIGQTVTVDGWSITLDKGMTDGTNVLLTLTVAPPEGTAWEDGYYNFDRFYMKPADSSARLSGSARSSWTDEVEDGKKTVALSFWYDPKQTGGILEQGGRWELVLENIRRDHEVTAQTEETIRGTWNFTFAFPATNGGVELLDGPTMSNSGTVELTSVRLSPLGLWIEYTAAGEEAADKVVDVLIDPYGYHPDFRAPTVVMKDGTEQVADGYGGSATISGSGIRKKLNYRFDGPILPENVDYLLFNDGTKIDIN